MVVGVLGAAWVVAGDPQHTAFAEGVEVRIVHAGQGQRLLLSGRENLSRLANSLGRRADVITVLWQDMDRRRKALLKAEKNEKKKKS